MVMDRPSLQERLTLPPGYRLEWSGQFEAMERAEQLRPILTELAGRSARATAAALTERKIATPTGGKWHAATVIRVQKRIGERHSDYCGAI